MYYTLKNAHNAIGLILLFLMLLIILFILVNHILNKPLHKSVQVAALVGLISVHLQILIGFALYFLSPLGSSNFSGTSMGHTISRFYIVEHPVGMILAGLLITLGYRVTKKTDLTDKSKYNRLLVYYLFGFMIISYLIPWFLWS